MITVVKIEKKSKTEKVGISLGQKAARTPGLIVIKELTNQNLVGQGLKVGQRIVSINGSCPPSAEKASIIIKETVGMLAIAAVDYLVEGKFEKKSKTEKVGISLARKADSTPGHIIIKELANQDLIGQGLKVGQLIVSINGSCPSSAEKASLIIKETVGMLTIVVDDDSSQRPMASTLQWFLKVLGWLSIPFIVWILVRQNISSPVRVGHLAFEF